MDQFIPSETYTGSREGYYFGRQGDDVGYFPLRQINEAEKEELYKWLDEKLLFRSFKRQSSRIIKE